MLGEFIAGVIAAGLGVFVFIYTEMHPKLTFAPVLSDGAPGAGFFPMIFSAILVVLGVALMMQNLARMRKKETNDEIQKKKALVTKENLLTAALLLAAVCVFLVAWKLTKQFYICISCLIFVINLLFKRSWKFSLIMSAALVLFLYLMFSVGFKIQFRV